MKTIPKTHLIIHLVGLVIFVVGIFLPYSSGLTMYKVNESSTIFEFAQEYYETTIRGHESWVGQLNAALILVISLIFFLARKSWFKYLLIPLGVIFLISQLLVFTTTLAGFGLPFGDSLHLGFSLMLLGTVIVILTTIDKLRLKSTKKNNDYNDF